MARLSLSLFGGFQASLDDAPLAGIYDHVRALLAYLATESDRPHRREFLAELLWPDEPEEVARRNLRQALSRLRAALGDRDAAESPFLLIDRTSIQFNRQSDHIFDVAAFIATAPPEKRGSKADLTVADLPWLEAACNLYRGHFLNQFYLPENSSFDQWVSARAEEHKQRALHYLCALTDYFGSTGDLQRGIAAARRQIELEPWREHAHRQLMHLLAKSGQRSAALAQYNVCRALLLDELGVEPEGDTESLRQSILRGEVEPASAPAAAARSPSGRRQVTVLYCALAEPTGVDPEDFVDTVRAFKQRCREVAARFEAYVEDSHGGAQIIIFGFPQAHEDDAQRALHASQRILCDSRQLAAQDKIPLSVRGGIHTGLMVTSRGDAADLPLDLIGTPLGIAVQLRYQAEANSFLLSADTERLVRGHFVVKEHLRAGLPELAPALPAYKLIRPLHARAQAERGRAGRLTPFVGREVELADLMELWGRVRAGQGQLVAVEGDAGIGKSRLIHMLKRKLLQEAHTLRSLRCAPGYQPIALPPAADLLHQTCDFRANDPDGTRQAKLSSALEQLGLHSNQGLILLSHLLGLPAGQALPQLGISPQQIKQNTLNLVVQMQQIVAQQRPMLVVIEDLNWVDPSTLELIKLLGRAVDQSPIMVLLTVRPGFEIPWRPAQNVTRLKITALGPAQIRRLATAIARNKALPEVVLQQIVARTDGVPLFVEELTKTLLESGLLRESHSRYELASPSPSVALPFTLHDSLMARLDRLESAKPLAQLAAVLGREFPYELLRDLSDLDEGELQRELARLLDADLLYQRHQDTKAIYGFRHALIHEAAYESLLRRHRQSLHRQVAQRLQAQKTEGAPIKPELLAHHYQEGGLIRDAVHHWHQAGVEATRHSAHKEAIAHLRRGHKLLDELPEDDQRDLQELALCTAIGVPLMLAYGPVPELEQAYARALELSQKVPDSSDLLPALRGLYTYYAGRADYHTAERLARQLLQLAEEQQREDFLLEGHRALGTSLLMRGELATAVHHLEFALRLYDPDRHHPLAYRYGMDPGIGALSVLSISDWIQGYPERARLRALDAVGLAVSRGHPSTIGWTLNIALTVMELRRDSQTVIELAEQLSALAEKHHTPLWMLWSSIMRNKALADLGRSDSPLEEIDDSFAQHERIGAAMGRPYALALWAQTCLRTGRIERGLEIVHDALAWVSQHSARLHEGELHRLEGELLAASAADPGGKQAEGAYSRALLLARAQGASAFELRAATAMGRLYIRHGRAEEVAGLLAPVLENFEGSDSRDVSDARELLETDEKQLATS